MASGWSKRRWSGEETLALTSVWGEPRFNITIKKIIITEYRQEASILHFMPGEVFNIWGRGADTCATSLNTLSSSIQCTFFSLTWGSICIEKSHKCIRIKMNSEFGGKTVHNSTCIFVRGGRRKTPTQPIRTEIKQPRSIFKIRNYPRTSCTFNLVRTWLWLCLIHSFYNRSQRNTALVTRTNETAV